MSTWTQEQLTALETAIAKGVRSVKYTDKEIVYRSLEEMLQLRDAMKRDLKQTPQCKRLFATHSKGTC